MENELKEIWKGYSDIRTAAIQHHATYRSDWQPYKMRNNLNNLYMGGTNNMQP